MNDINQVIGVIAIIILMLFTLGLIIYWIKGTARTKWISIPLELIVFWCWYAVYLIKCAVW